VNAGQEFDGLGEFTGSLDAIEEIRLDYRALAERVIDAEGALANAHRTIQAQKEEMAAMLAELTLQGAHLTRLRAEAPSGWQKSVVELDAVISLQNGTILTQKEEMAAMLGVIDLLEKRIQEERRKNGS